jgi:hypothetical protein
MTTWKNKAYQQRADAGQFGSCLAIPEPLDYADMAPLQSPV